MIKKLIQLLEKIDRLSFKNEVDYQYVRITKKILEQGSVKIGRNGKTIGIFGEQVRFDLSKGLPILTIKQMFTRSQIHELIWFLRGNTSGKYLVDNNVKIWDLWMTEDKDLPNTYPMMWRKFPSHNGIDAIDQLADIIKDLKTNPSSRRMIVSAWCPSLISKSALPPCHSFFQFFVTDNKLSCHVYQRSADWSLGTATVWFTYSILTHMLAQICNLEVGELVWSGGDVHIYENQIEHIKKIFGRKTHSLPKLKLNPLIKNIDDFTFEDISIEDYKYEPYIKIPVSQ